MDNVASLRSSLPTVSGDAAFYLTYLTSLDYPELIELLREPQLWTAGFGDGAGSQPTDDAGYLAFIREQLDEPTRLNYALRDNRGHLLGIISYYRIEPRKRRVEIGRPVLHRSLWGRGYIHQAIMALTMHALACGYHRVQAETDAINQRLIGILQDAGFVLEGIRRHSSLHADGSRRDIQIYSVTLEEWADPLWRDRYLPAASATLVA